MKRREPHQNTQIRNVFFVSDRTGLTAETYGKSLLAQFPDLEFVTVTLAFVDTTEKALQAREQINEVSLKSSLKPVVFSTLVDDNEQYIIESSQACVINLFHTFVGPLENCFEMESAHRQGLSRTVFGDEGYLRRLDAIDYSLTHDDGLLPDQYQEADVILLGVSRCGKTPTSLYLAMNFSLKVSNYPLTGEDLEAETLPAFLLEQRHKLAGLTIKAVPLSRIRQKRRPDSDYASLQVCQYELEKARVLFEKSAVPVFDTTNTSIEEISGQVVRTMGLGRERTGVV